MSFSRYADILCRSIRKEKRYIILVFLAGFIVILTLQSAKTEKEVVSFATTGTSPSVTSTSIGSEDEIRWFDPAALLQKTIQKLEVDGWKAPLGKGAISRRLIKIKKMMPKSIEVTVDKEPSEKIVAVADRWKVSSMGCFYDQPKRPALLASSVTTQVTSLAACISRCDKEGKPYVSVIAGAACRCGTKLSKAAVMVPVEPKLCNMKCKDPKENKLCGGRSYANVYRIAYHSMENFTLSEFHEKSMGCFRKPKLFDENFGTGSTLPNGTPAQCLLHCEKSNSVIAAWDPMEQCRCGMFDSRYGMNQLQRVNDETLCDVKCSSRTNCERYVRIMRTYSEDQRCDTRTFFTKPFGNMTALISFPGSGNTWVRYLIESATGIYSGSVYNDVKLFENGFAGELLSWKSRRTSVVKTHESDDGTADKFDAAIMIVRSPYDAFMAEFNRVAGGHVGYADPKLFKMKEWAYFVAYKLGKWLKVIEEYSRMKRIHVVYFEDIVMDPVSEVREMVRFLKIPVVNLEERLICLGSNIGGNFKRTKRKLDFDPFSKEMKDGVNKFIQRAREITKQYRLPVIPYYER